MPPDLTNAVAISAGFAHSVGLRSDGSVALWGDNTYGQLNVPASLSGVLAASAGSDHTVVLVGGSRLPLILDQPGSQTAIIGSTAAFVVRAVGPMPLTYRWLFGTNEIMGATNSVLVLQNVQPSQSGQYTAFVSNSGGTTMSQPGYLSVVPWVDVHTVPRVTLVGALGFTYQLQYINEFGPTNNWQTVAALMITNKPQYYYDESAIGQPTRFYRLVQVP